MSDEWSRDDFAINEEHQCNNCGYDFGEGEAERRTQAYLEGSALCAIGRPDLCPGCDIQLIKWARD